MKRAFICAIYLLTSFGTAHANQIVVRSGEHNNFTRLVMPIPDGIQWSLEENVGTATIVLDGFKEGFDLSFAFEIIPRTRLNALVARNSELELQLSCDCPVNAFVERNGFLVVDITDGPEIDTNRVESSKSIPVLASNFSYGQLLWSNDDTTIASPDLKVENNDPAKPIQSTDTEIVMQAQERLLEAFSAAATQGLVNTKQGLPTLIPSPEDAASDLTIFDSSQLVEETDLSPKEHIRISNSKDIPQEERVENIGISGNICPDPNLVKIASWGTEQDFGNQLGYSNRNLFDELGRLKKGRVEERAKLYLFFGFGAEARRTLKMDADISRERPELWDLADILEYGHVKEPRFFHRFADCDSELALWGILSEKKIDPEKAINAPAALRALQTLPAHLKFILAEELSKRLIERGDISNASVALRTYQRLQANNSKQPKIISSQLAVSREEISDSSRILNAIISEGTVETPEAIIALVENSISSNTALPADIALLAETYAFEFRNSEKGSEMLRSHVLAAAKSAQFAKVFEVLNDSSRFQSFDRKTQSEIVSFVFSEFTKSSQNLEFLSGFFQQFPQKFDLVEDRVKIEIAKRILELGFAEDASAVIASLPDKMDSTDLNIAKSKILLLSGQLPESLESLNGIEGSEAELIRGEILEQLGQNQRASIIFAEAALNDRAISSLWLSEDWMQLIPQANPLFGPLRQLHDEPTIQIERAENMLQNTEIAIASSEAARASLQEVLAQLAKGE